ncbi:hypothetical protein M9Y10_027672 [Tritrichomonas musculus]|uniref:Uncharacterized protein n=1 Tax=Tritrichomonas musculus TaxID=1915356 RepID=A0ABR2H5Y2_9EUKA
MSLTASVEFDVYQIKNRVSKTGAIILELRCSIGIEIAIKISSVLRSCAFAYN